MPSVRLLEPSFLFLLVLVPFVYFLPRQVKDLRHGSLRAAFLALLICGLARPVAVRADERAHITLVLDVSESIADRDTVRSRAEALLTTFPGSASVAWLEVGRGAVAGVDHGGVISEVSSAPGSPLSAALGRALANVPDGSMGAVVLASDGAATDDRFEEMVQRCARRALPIHVIPVAGASGSVTLARLEATAVARVGATATIEAHLFGGPSEVIVHLEGPDGELARSASVRVEGETSTAIQFEPDRAGFLPLRAYLEVVGGVAAPADGSSLGFTLPVHDPVRVLHLGARMLGGSERLGELVGRGFHLESDRAGAADGPTSALPDPSEFDLVMLDDRPAATVPREWQEQLVVAVREQGVGLVMSGGGGAFGPGGWHDTPVADILPVDLVQKEEKKDPSTALAIIIDTSGSMSGQRIVLAKEVARLAIQRLLPHDKVGIVEFYGAKRWAAPLQSAANAIAIQRALNRLDAGGGTVILPAIEEAYYGLRNTETRYKHCLILTDAGVEQGAFEPLLRRMARDGMCISTVLVGPERHSEFLVELANWGNGRFYNASDRFNLPEVILKQPSTARLPGYRPGETALTVRGGPGWWGGVPPTAVPPLLGYVETRMRAHADVLLETASERHPVLATWHHGLGRVTTFATEPTGPGTESFRPWPDYGRFLARVLSRTAGDDLLPYRFDVARRDDQLEIVATALDPRLGAPEVTAEIGSESRSLGFEEVAPRTFRFRAVVDPALLVRAEVALGGRCAQRFVAPPADPEILEGRIPPSRRISLESTAAVTGGELLGAAHTGGVRVDGVGLAVRTQALWPLAFVLALLAYLADVVYRRSTRSVMEG